LPRGQPPVGNPVGQLGTAQCEFVIDLHGWLNVNSVHSDTFPGSRTGAGWSQTFYGAPETVALTGATYAQGQGQIFIDNHLYGYVFSKDIYVG